MNGQAGKNHLMPIKYLLIFLLHSATVCFYLIATSYVFINYHQADPIGTALQQLACFIVHLLLTALICLIVQLTAVDKKKAMRDMWVNFLAIVIPFIVYLLFSNALLGLIVAYACGDLSLESFCRFMD